MKKQVFVINGSAGVGKDTFVGIVGERIGICAMSSIDIIKKIAYQCGCINKETEKDRKFLCDLKRLCSEYNDLPFRCIEKEVKYFLENSDFGEMMFLHIREPEEIKRAKEQFNAHTILIRRDCIKHITSNDADKNVFNYEYDTEINNSGSLDSLIQKAEEFISDFKKGVIKHSY